MADRTRRLLRHGAALLGALGLVLVGAGCAHYEVHSAPRTTVVHAGPPPWAPAHGYRHHHSEAWIVYDSALECYAVDGHADHYFYRNAFYRHRDGRWERARSLRGGWAIVSAESVPARLGHRYARVSRPVEGTRHDLRRRERHIQKRSRELEQRHERLRKERERQAREHAREMEKERERHQRSLAKARRQHEREKARLERARERSRGRARETRHDRRETKRSAAPPREHQETKHSAAPPRERRETKRSKPRRGHGGDADAGWDDEEQGKSGRGARGARGRVPL